MAVNLRDSVLFPITVREVEVLAVRDVTPGMRRVTLGGPRLAAHTAPNGMPVHAFRSEGFDDEFKVFLTHPDLDEPLRPEQGEGRIVWPRDPHLISRTYTVRRWDPQAQELDVDFVVHGDGPATTWAQEVEPGQRVPIAGPKMSWRHPRDVDSCPRPGRRRGPTHRCALRLRRRPPTDGRRHRSPRTGGRVGVLGHP